MRATSVCIHQKLTLTNRNCCIIRCGQASPLSYTNEYSFPKLQKSQVTVHFAIDTTVTKYATIGDRTFYVAGQYSYVVPSADDCDTIIDLNLRILDEPEIYDISPNPAKSIISISSEDYITYVEFFSTTGRPVMQKEINAKQTEINVEEFAPEIYFVRLYGEDGIAPTIQRFVKE